MKKVLNFFLVISLVLLTPLVSAGTWRVPERDVPPPAGASAELHSAIAGAPRPRSEVRAITPDSDAQWRQLVDLRRKTSAVSLQELGARLGVTIERDVMAGVAVHRVTPETLSAKNRARRFVYLHGGAYVFGGGDASVREGALIASFTGIPVVSVDYRMPPDHPQPAAVQDVLAVYRELLQSLEPGAIGMGGTSAGGGLTLAAVHHFKSQGLPLPGALYLGTPWADLSKTSDSLYTNEGIDRVLVTYDGLLSAAAELYANGEDLKDPLISPVYGDFKAFPPSYLLTGTRDMLLSDTVRVHRKMRIAGVEADLNVYEGMSHAEYAILVGSPEWRQAYEELAAFLHEHLAHSPTVNKLNAVQ